MDAYRLGDSYGLGGNERSVAIPLKKIGCSKVMHSTKRNHKKENFSFSILMFTDIINERAKEINKQ